MFDGDISLKSWIAKFCPNEIVHVVDENLIVTRAVEVAVLNKNHGTWSDVL